MLTDIQTCARNKLIYKVTLIVVLVLLSIYSAVKAPKFSSVDVLMVLGLSLICAGGLTAHIVWTRMPKKDEDFTGDM